MTFSELISLSHLLLHALDGNRISERAGDVVGAKGVGGLLRELWTEGNEQRPSFKSASQATTYMNEARDAGGVHPGCDVDGVAPDVVERLLRAHHAGDHGAAVHPHPQTELGLPRNLVLKGASMRKSRPRGQSKGCVNLAMDKA